MDQQHRFKISKALMGNQNARKKPAPKCNCPKFGDTGGFRIADLTCPTHGVNGTDPGDGYWDADPEVIPTQTGGLDEQPVALYQAQTRSECLSTWCAKPAGHDGLHDKSAYRDLLARELYAELVKQQAFGDHPSVGVMGGHDRRTVLHGAFDIRAMVDAILKAQEQ